MKRLIHRKAKKNLKTSDKRGMSALAWMLISIGVMFMLYIPTDLTVRMILGQEMNGILDNAVSAAVAQIEEGDIASGEITIDPIRAERTVYEVIGYAYNLDVIEENTGAQTLFRFDESGLEDSKLRSVPDIEFQHIPFSRGDVNLGVTKDSLPFSDGTVYHSMANESIVIRVTTEYPTLFMNFLGGMEVSRISASQAQLAPALLGGD